MSKKYFEKLARSSGVSNKEFKSDFGLKILKKFGWEEGKGLGLNEDGTQDCVQIKKRDNGVGLGAEKVESTNDKNWENWWADSYNSVAKNIDLKGGTKKDDDSSDSSDSDDDDTVAGGGRPTSVKGARFQRGKLARVMRQERGPLASKAQNNDSDSSDSDSSDSDSSDSDDAKDNVPDFLKKLREWQQKNNGGEKPSTSTAAATSPSATTAAEGVKEEKKKKKKASTDSTPSVEKATDSTPSSAVAAEKKESGPTTTPEKKKKKGEDFHPHAGESCTRFATPIPESEKKKKKKRSRDEENTAPATTPDDAGEAPKKKKSKKEKA